LNKKELKFQIKRKRTKESEGKAEIILAPGYRFNPDSFLMLAFTASLTILLLNR
jgi:hypothetical protein